MENKLAVAETNKLFAEFLGWIKTWYGYNTWKACEDGEERYVTPFEWQEPDSSSLMSSRHDFDVRYMLFNTWDWLMLVVTKIEDLGYEVQIGRISCQINPILERENPIASMVCGDITKKREIVFEVCKQFIEWYNEKQSKIN